LKESYIHGNKYPSRYFVFAVLFVLKTYEALLAGTFYLYHEFVYGHVGVEDHIHGGVEKLRNWNPVLIVFLLYTPYSVLFHADRLWGVYNQTEVRVVLFSSSPTSDVWIPDPLHHHHHHHFGEEWRGIHGLSQMIMCEQLC
jgi:hypothetical protein